MSHPAEVYLRRGGRLVDAELRALLRRSGAEPPRLRRAMAYSLLSGGKRLRPCLALAACQAVGGRPRRALPWACALELVHTYSLVHDDLPAMDDDDWRRGRPACHVAFDQATAILVGDALLTLAFETLAAAAGADGRIWSRVTMELARAAGAAGMVGGQALDLAAVGRRLPRARLERLHARKTGALIRAAVRGGALLGGARGAALRALGRYGANIGLAFQIADDLLDIHGGPALGKTRGKDLATGKATFPALLGEAESARRMRALTAGAIRELAGLGRPAEPLRQLASYAVERAR